MRGAYADNFLEYFFLFEDYPTPEERVPFESAFNMQGYYCQKCTPLYCFFYNFGGLLIVGKALIVGN